MRAVGFLIFLFFFLIPAGIFFLILAKGLKGAKEDEWEGEVVDKLYKTKTVYQKDEITGRSKKDVSGFYTIVFKTNKGERKLAVTKNEFEKWQIGDKARKVKGKFEVERCEAG